MTRDNLQAILICVVLLLSLSVQGICEKAPLAPQQEDKQKVAKANEFLTSAGKLLEMGNKYDAMKDCQSAVELAPDNHLIMFDASVILRDAEYYDLSIDLLRKCIAQDPELSLYHVDLAVTYEAKGMDDAGKAEAASALELAKSVPAFSFTQAMRYISYDLPGFAIPELRNVLKFKPKSAAILTTLAMAYENNGQEQQAKAAYAKAIALDPKSTFIRYNYGVYLQQKRSFTAAVEQYSLAKKYRSSKPTTIDFSDGTKFPIPQPTAAQLDDAIKKSKAHKVSD